jgi:hypothetical protein
MADYVSIEGQVIFVGPVEAKGAFKIAKISVADRTKGITEISVFVEDELNLTVNQDVTCKATVKEYKGKPQHSTSRKYMKVFSGATHSPKVVEKPIEQPILATKEEKVDWGQKDRRMYAQNALRHADEWIKSMPDSAPITAEQEYFRFAEEAYKWIISK